MIFEVKDWSLTNYAWRNTRDGKRVLCVDTPGGLRPIKSPVDQVSYYREKIIGQLVPSIGEEIDDEQRAFGLIKVGLYFHTETTEVVRRFFDRDAKPHTPIVGYDALTPDKLSILVPDVRRERSSLWREAWNEELSFWLNPPMHAIEQSSPLTLTDAQRQHAEPNPGHHRLRGVAGSGKTQILAYRAAKLAAEGKRVLILTFNITLWHYIRDMVARSPFAFSWKQITLNHFHGFCKDILNAYGVPWPTSEGEDVFRRDVPMAVLAAIEGQAHERWDAILIDEGQDYYWEWYDLLSRFTTERDELLFVCDKRQNIYGRDLNWIDSDMRNVKFRGRWGELKTVFRLPPVVAEYAKDFAGRFGLKQDVQIEGVIQQSLFERPLDPHTVWIDTDRDEWPDWMEIVFCFLTKHGHSPSDIALLVPDRATGMAGLERFERRGIGVNHVFEDDEAARYHRHKKAFWMGDGRLKMCTIHSFKGWEARAVVLFIPEDWPSGESMMDRLVYTAITRTRENLVVFNANPRYRDFGRTLPHHWTAPHGVAAG
jgi:superfamily I DNA/RNA helicase